MEYLFRSGEQTFKILESSWRFLLDSLSKCVELTKTLWKQSYLVSVWGPLFEKHQDISLTSGDGCEGTSSQASSKGAIHLDSSSLTLHAQLQRIIPQELMRDKFQKFGCWLANLEGLQRRVNNADFEVNLRMLSNLVDFTDAPSDGFSVWDGFQLCKRHKWFQVYSRSIRAQCLHVKISQMILSV